MAIFDKGKAVNQEKLTWQQALRDTEYSHPLLFDDNDPYVYHCGYDIFNNHRLRSNTFTYINKVSSADTENTTFNTLWDFVRDRSGNTISEVVSLINNNETDVHVYGVDTIRTMEDCFINEIREENGWYGFINKTDIDIPNATITTEDGEEEDISINKVLNNNRACEFIDLYPDRSLYSFIPKVNKYRNRLEKNWDYCITYPYENDYAKFNEIVGLDSGLTINEGGCSLKIIQYEITKSPSGNKLIRFKTMFKHTLESGDYIRLYYNDNGNLNEINKLVKVISIGNYEGQETNRYFSISFRDIASEFDIFESGDTKCIKLIGSEGCSDVDFYYRKTINGVDYQYYIRKFKKIKIDDKELSSDINKLAYGENIYGDRLAQIIFTDTIDVDGLVDNNGRQLSEIFFTVIKRNAGHDLWYSGITNSEDIEFSHCFGKVTSGIDMPEDVNDYNVRKLHNIDLSAAGETTIEALQLEEGATPIEDDITIDNDEFYGDIIEFNPLEYIETTLEIVQHRFNTAQRELVSDDYKDILYDELQYDDYDEGITCGFTINEKYINKYNGEEYYGNLNPEGYFYNPFTRIQLKEENDTINTVIGSNIKFNSISDMSSSNEIKSAYTFNVETMVDYNIIKGDALCFYNMETKEHRWYGILESSGVNITFISDEDDIIDADNTLIVKTKEGVPLYAKYIPSIHTFIWRGLKNASELPVSSNLYDMPFANGCFYIHQNVNFFLKRQDPTGEYGLLPTNPNNPLNKYNIPGWDKVDLSNDTYYNDNDFGRICY